MTEQSTSFEEAMAQATARIDSGQFTSKEGLQIALATVVGLIKGDRDRRTKNDLDAERAMFDYLSQKYQLARLRDHSLNKALFNRWVMNSENLYAVAYRLGRSFAIADISAKNAKRATNGRRLIGATSRQKVLEKSEKFRHKSKDAAATDIGDAVGLSSGTVKRYLTELFPGDKWSK